MKFYKQRDYFDKLGFGTTTIAGYGCKLTSFSMLSEIDPPTLNKQFKKDGAFSGDLLTDSLCAKSLGWTFKERTTKKPKEVCIAEVDMSPAPGKQQHFVVFLANGTIIDPWTGTIRPETTYPFVSFRLFDMKALDKPSDKKQRIIIDSKTSDTSNEVQVPPNPIQTVESGLNNQINDNTMNLQGYRTIISAVLAFVVSMGAVSQVEADQLTEGVLAILSLVTLVSTIYFRIKAKK